MEFTTNQIGNIESTEKKQQDLQSDESITSSSVPTTPREEPSNEKSPNEEQNSEFTADGISSTEDSLASRGVATEVQNEKSDQPTIEESYATNNNVKEEEEDDWERKADDELLNLEPGKESLESKSRPGDISSVAALSMIPVEFPEGSWKPATTEKRIYDRSFLLGFQPLCIERPDGLPSMDAILGRDEVDMSRESSRGGPRQLSFSSGRGGGTGRGPPGLFRFGSEPQLGARGPPGLSGSHRGGREFHPPMERGGIAGRGPYNQMRRSGEHPGKKQHQAPMGKQGPPLAGLQSSGNRWERPRLSGDSEKDRVELILRKARRYSFFQLTRFRFDSLMINPFSILNKLTLEKFDSLSNQLLNIGINNVDVLRGLIGLVFEKALAEPHFSGMYADLCVKMSEKSLEFADPNAANTEQVYLTYLDFSTDANLVCMT